MNPPPTSSDLAGLDGETPLTPEERLHIRRLIREDDRATWLRKQIRVFLPVAVAVVAAVWGAVDWIMRHIKWAP